MDTQAWIDQNSARLTATIRRNGWSIEYILGASCSRPDCECASSDEPAFAYTVGLFGLGHAELLIFGVPPRTAAGVLNELAGRIRGGETLLPEQMITCDGWVPRIVPEPVPNPGDIVFNANDFYRRPDEFSVPVLQLSYDDEAGIFPFEDGYSAPEMQPRPGTFKA